MSCISSTHEPGARYARGIRRVTALPIASRRLGIAGVADLVEFHVGAEGRDAYPVEYKRGKPKPHRADEVQLCAQALCLEEMTGRPCSKARSSTAKRNGASSWPLTPISVL